MILALRKQIQCRKIHCINITTRAFEQKTTFTLTCFVKMSFQVPNRHFGAVSLSLGSNKTRRVFLLHLKPRCMDPKAPEHSTVQNELFHCCSVYAQHYTNMAHNKARVKLSFACVCSSVFVCVSACQSDPDLGEKRKKMVNRREVNLQTVSFILSSLFLCLLPCVWQA